MKISESKMSSRISRRDSKRRYGNRCGDISPGCNSATDSFPGFVSVVYTVRLHIMQRTVLQRPFCPSVCLSVKRVDCDKTKETYARILIPRERSFIPVFWQEE